MTSIAKALGFIIDLIYSWIPNYGVAIIFFTLIVRLVLLPLNIKQQKSMIKMQKINPLLAKIQEKYKNDKDKAAQETMKLYKEYKISPFSGCLPLLIQFPILIALIWVIYDPAKYMFGVDTSTLFADVARNNLTLARLQYAVDACGLNANFLGINLVAIPDFKSVTTLWIFPILSTVATYVSGKITQAQQGASPNTDAGSQAAQTSRMMTTVMPLMTLFFTFTMPVAASFYWFISSAVQILQTLVLKVIIKVDDIPLNDGGTWHERNSKKRKKG